MPTNAKINFQTSGWQRNIGYKYNISEQLQRNWVLCDLLGAPSCRKLGQILMCVDWDVSPYILCISGSTHRNVCQAFAENAQKSSSKATLSFCHPKAQNFLICSKKATPKEKVPSQSIFTCPQKLRFFPNANVVAQMTKADNSHISFLSYVRPLHKLWWKKFQNLVG